MLGNIQAHADMHSYIHTISDHHRPKFKPNRQRPTHSANNLIESKYNYYIYFSYRVSTYEYTTETTYQPCNCDNFVDTCFCCGVFEII